MALLLVVLVGMVGLVVDGALLTATHRQAQNAADAAALAAAMDRMRGRSKTDATATATAFVQNYNGLTTAPAPTVNIPPATGPYAGVSGYSEVIVRAPVRTYLIHVLGVAREQQVEARAVAGYEARSSGEGVMVLNPDARPGVNISGGGTLRVQGRVVVNSEGGGVDEDGVRLVNSSGQNITGTAAAGGQPNSTTGIFAEDIEVVGGVDNPLNFKAYDSTQPSPLACRMLPETDPLLRLSTPTVANGVDPTLRGEVSVTNQTILGITATAPGAGGINFIASSGAPVPGRSTPAAEGEVILFPGVYGQLQITGGNVYFVPGIYVLSPKKNLSDALKITGGTVTAERVMFYNTSISYSPLTGLPDTEDVVGDEGKTPLPNTEYAGGFNINASMKFSPIDTTQFNYSQMQGYPLAPAVSPEFNGMLFFQRRRHQASIQIAGDSEAGKLAGTLYAKWSNFQISGQGTYDAQFICGSMTVTGQGNVTIRGAGETRGRANQIYLVE